MGIETAIIGSAIVGAGASYASGRSAARANQRGADAAAEATVESTRMQIEEMRRQFDAQMELLGPMLEAQYAAQAFFSEVLGFGGYNAETGQWEAGGPGDMGFYQEGGFFDPNLNPMALGAENWLESDFGQLVNRTLLAGEDPTSDVMVQRAEDTALGTNYLNDPRLQYAQETGNLVGTEFETSPGYGFAREEMDRALDRRLSVGSSNYGGRAVIEAQRRAKGLADQEYYNWLGQRRLDLDRTDRALGVAVGDSRRREELNLRRGDAAYANYFGRRAGDVSRLDQAVLTNRQQLALDRQRQDQGYYNYLNYLMGGSNSGAVNTAVGSSAQVGAGVANAYGNQGNALASIWQNFGQNDANIAIGMGAGLNNAIQSGIQNWMLNSYLGG